MILGQSGRGKSYSMHNLNPEKTLLIQAIKKPLPFKSKGWAYYDKEKAPTGNIFVSDQSAKIVAVLEKSKRPIVVIDDFQYILANEFMRRVLDKETGNASFAKYNEIARNAWDILMAAGRLDDNRRVYILSHSQEDDSGRTKAKTIGKLLDEKITVEGLFSIVFGSCVINEQFLFSTKNSGSDTVKTPFGMFDETHIPNDLALVDQKICEYYEIATTEGNANV